jgi:hypothetical protein
MPNACVKNVYGMCMTSGKFEHLHTPSPSAPRNHVYNLATYTRLYAHHHGVIMHMAQSWFSSVPRQLYPFSTRPIISKAN